MGEHTVTGQEVGKANPDTLGCKDSKEQKQQRKDNEFCPFMHG
jgi:hypothetical protein